MHMIHIYTPTHTYKKAFLSDQCKEREESNRMGKTRDLFKKVRDNKGTFHEKMLNITHYQRNANQNQVRYHFTPVRMAAIPKSTSNKWWRGYGGKGTLLHCW